MDYGQIADMKYTLEPLIAEDNDVLDMMLREHFSGSVVMMMRTIWHQGTYCIMSEILQSREENAKEIEVTGA